MDVSNVQSDIESAVTKHGLSHRAAGNSLQTSPWDMVEKLFSNLWTPKNPEGLVFLGVAENPLLHNEIAQYITDHFSIDPHVHLGYGAGPRGSPRLRKALALLFNNKFRALEPVLPTEIFVLPGVVSVLDSLTWSICNEGEGIIVPLPYYTGFSPAIKERSRGIIIPATFQCLDSYHGLDDIFDPEMNRQALQAALTKASHEGVKARAVLLSNPHNPIGRCYDAECHQPKETLREIASFCGRHSLHLISDEIFALSVYEPSAASSDIPFTSVLSLDLRECLDRHFVHVAYGMSKDFCANGLRLAALQSRNQGLLSAVTSICVFSWVPYVIQDVWAIMLEDKEFSEALASKNRQLLGEHHGIITQYLDTHGIQYYQKTNAGCFVWVDLRPYLCDSTANPALPTLSRQSLSTMDLKKYEDRESKLFVRCMNGGVGISRGSGFYAEELGWFRISFTVEKDALRVGLARLLKCLEENRLDDWKS